MVVPHRLTRFSLPSAWFGVVFLVLGLVAAPLRADELADGARAFVRELATEAVVSLASRDITQTERERNFRRLLLASFDVPVIGKWALGRYWRAASKSEQEEFLSLFEDFIVTSYAGRFREYTNEQLEITEVVKAMDEEGGLVVQSLIVRDQPKPIRVDWRVATTGGYKIVDVVVEGVSMVQTQRSEFSSVILRNGGKVSGLITELKLKTQSLRAQAN
jgi:phospholipid transport system substrate-binding protein